MTAVSLCRASGCRRPSLASSVGLVAYRCVDEVVPTYRQSVNGLKVEAGRLSSERFMKRPACVADCDWELTRAATITYSKQLVKFPYTSITEMHVDISNDQRVTERPVAVCRQVR